MAFLILCGILIAGGGLVTLLFTKDTEASLCFMLAGIVLLVMGILLVSGFQPVEKHEPYKIVVSENVHYVGHDTEVGDYVIVQR